MSNKRLLKMNPHTKAKHTILEHYLKGWFPIMSKFNGRIIYLDGFAGSGIYDSGDFGSPVIALRVAKEHVLQDMMLKGEKGFYFVEKDHARFSTLNSVLTEQFGPWGGVNNLDALPQNFKVNVSEGDFNKEIKDILDSIEVHGTNLAPTFAFVDPYSYSLDLSLLSRIIAYPKCEVLFTFMVGFLDRFVFAEEHIDAITRTFCIDKSKIERIRTIENKDERDEYLGSMLVNLLKGRLSAHDNLYWLSFKMIDKHNNIMYWLMFFTKSVKGMEVMKSSMFDICRQGDYTFSDFNFSPDQTSILDYSDGTEQWVLNAADYLSRQLLGKQMQINDIKTYVTLYTPYVYKAKILKELEGKDKIRVQYAKNRRLGSYPDGCSVEFL